jgi:hypothetical protein
VESQVILLENENLLTKGSKKLTWLSQMGYRVNLAPQIFTHWMQMDDIRGVSTICKGLVAAHEAGFGSDYGEESKSFHQRQRKQQND